MWDIVVLNTVEKATEKIMVRRALLTYLVVFFSPTDFSLRINYFEEASLGRCNFRWWNIFSQREFKE